MKTSRRLRRTALGDVDEEILKFTVGRDLSLDLELAPADCIGSAAHVTMLSRMRMRRRIFSDAERRKVVKELVRILRRIGKGQFRIELADQDVHMAVERMLTARLGDLGRKVHTGRSRNDQVAVDLRLYGKEQLLAMIEEAAVLAEGLRRFAAAHRRRPMVGRTHMQPAMPSSVGLWASAHAESLLDDVVVLISAYELNDQCPLGSAAGYGVPLPLDRELTASLLGFSRPVVNVLYAASARGKVEGLILCALSQVMITLSRLAQDLMLYGMPEFGYFTLPAAFGTGSSIMPQKNNPDALELVRAHAAAVISRATGVMETLRALPSGYNRDLQATKEPFIEGIRTTRSSLRIMALITDGLGVDERALRRGFAPAVFAADAALDMVALGVPFRRAYQRLKEEWRELAAGDPEAAALRKRHLGAPGSLGLESLSERIGAATEWVAGERRAFYRAVSRLLGVNYPLR